MTLSLADVRVASLKLQQASLRRAPRRLPCWSGVTPVHPIPAPLKLNGTLRKPAPACRKRHRPIRLYLGISCALGTTLGLTRQLMDAHNASAGRAADHTVSIPF